MPKTLSVNSDNRNPVNKLLVIILLLITVTISFYFIKHCQNKKTYNYIIEMESSNKLRETDVKNHTCYYFDDIVNVNDLHLDNILLDEKTYKNFNFNL